MGPQKVTTARWLLEREKKKLEKFYKGNENVISVKSPLMRLSFLINILDHVIFRKNENASCACELLFPPILFCFDCPESKSFGRHPRPQHLRNSF